MNKDEALKYPEKFKKVEPNSSEIAYSIILTDKNEIVVENRDGSTTTLQPDEYRDIVNETIFDRMKIVPGGRSIDANMTKILKLAASKM